MDVSKRLSELHNRSGQSQQAATEMIKRKTGADVHQTTFGSWLRGDREPLIGAVATMAQAYNVSIEWLCGMIDDKRPVPVILDRLREVTFPADVEAAAKLLSTMPEDQRRLHIAQIEADAAERRRNEDRWQRLLRSVEMAGLSIDDFEDVIDTAPLDEQREVVSAAPQLLFELAR